MPARPGSWGGSADPGWRRGGIVADRDATVDEEGIGDFGAVAASVVPSAGRSGSGLTCDHWTGFFAARTIASASARSGAVCRYASGKSESTKRWSGAYSRLRHRRGTAAGPHRRAAGPAAASARCAGPGVTALDADHDGVSPAAVDGSGWGSPSAGPGAPGSPPRPHACRPSRPTDQPAATPASRTEKPPEARGTLPTRRGSRLASRGRHLKSPTSRTLQARSET